MLFIRSKLHYPASGIITPIGVMVVMIPDDDDDDDDEHMCSKHVEA